MKICGFLLIVLLFNGIQVFPSQNHNKILAEIKGVNYYPQDSPWDTFGDSFNIETLHSDFQIIRNMGLNTIRIFVQYNDFGGAKIPIEKLEYLDTLMSLASREGLGVIVTLFDFYNSYDPKKIDENRNHLLCLINSIKNHSNLIAWDVKNEPDLDFTFYKKEVVLTWLKTMVEEIRRLDKWHPITIGWSTPEAALNLKNEVDFLSFHFYKELSFLKGAMDQLREKTKKPIVLTEFGYSSYSKLSNLFVSSEKKQAQYYERALTTISEEDLPFLFWTLYDFRKIPVQVVGEKRRHQRKQKHFGIIGLNKKKKQAFKFVNQNKDLFNISLNCDY